MYNDTLQHYGVLGMKWGRRKVSRLSNKQKKIAAKKVKYKKILDSEFKNVGNRIRVSDDGSRLSIDRAGKKSFRKSVRTAIKISLLDRRARNVSAKREELISKIKASEAKRILRKTKKKKKNK